MPKDPSYLTGRGAQNAMGDGGRVIDEASGGASAGLTSSAFLSTMTISRPTKVEDVEGGRTHTWVSVGVGVCRVNKMAAPRETEIGGKVATVATFQIQFPLIYRTSTPLYARDRIITEGQTFELLDSDRGLADASAWTWWAVRIGPQ